MHLIEDYVQSFFNQHQNELKQHYAGLSSQILLDSFIKYSGKHKGDYLGTCDHQFFDEVLLAKPLEYINEEKFFFRSPFYVNPDVLIPRNETEILVEDSINYILKNYHPNFSVAEVGVGSFALGLSILIDVKNPIHFWGGDLCEKALKVASVNQFKLSSKINPESKIELKVSDRLAQTSRQYDLIVSNPPYIREKDQTLVHDSVHNAEPHLALYLADDIYIEWFSSFFDEVHEHLKDNGAFLMEGHEDTLEELKQMAQMKFANVMIKQDYTGRNRFLHCYK